MVVVQVYSKNIKIKYKSTLLSIAAIFFVLSSIALVVVPYIIAYHTEGFWTNENVFYEQPKVDVRGEYLFIALTDNLSHPIVCSTFPFYKEHMNHLDNCALFRIREIDNNFDSKSDQLDFQVRINLFNLSLTSIGFIVPVNYELKSTCPLKMQSAIIFQQYFHQKTITELTIMADLLFFQSSALHCDEKHYNFYDRPIIGSEGGYNDFQLNNLMEKYFERNLTTHLTNLYTFIKTENKDTFSIKLLVQYPMQKVYYIPSLWHKIKMAWIQYFAMFVIVSWILNKIKDFMYHRKWLLFYEESPIKKNI